MRFQCFTKSGQCGRRCHILRQTVPCSSSSNIKCSILPIVDSLNGGTTRRSVLAERRRRHLFNVIMLRVVRVTGMLLCILRHCVPLCMHAYNKLNQSINLCVSCIERWCKCLSILSHYVLLNAFYELIDSLLSYSSPLCSHRWRLTEVQVRRPRLVLGWVTTREDRALWTCWVRSSVWTSICAYISPLSCWFVDDD